MCTQVKRGSLLGTCSWALVLVFLEQLIEMLFFLVIKLLEIVPFANQGLVEVGGYETVNASYSYLLGFQLF